MNGKGRNPNSRQVGTKLRTSNYGFGCFSSNLGCYITEETAGRALYGSIGIFPVGDKIIETIAVSFGQHCHRASIPSVGSVSRKEGNP